MWTNSSTIPSLSTPRRITGILFQHYYWSEYPDRICTLKMSILFYLKWLVAINQSDYLSLKVPMWICWIIQTSSEDKLRHCNLQINPELTNQSCTSIAGLCCPILNCTIAGLCCNQHRLGKIGSLLSVRGHLTPYSRKSPSLPNGNSLHQLNHV